MIVNAHRSEVETLPGLRKAAMLLIVLGEQASAEVMQHLTEDEVQKVSKEVAKIRPSIIISSSGMLTLGSPSSFYATEFANDERCLTAISGYQDEESPGRKPPPEPAPSNSRLEALDSPSGLASRNVSISPPGN